MSSSNPTLQIPSDVIEPIIQARISAEIAKVIGTESIIRQAVDRLLQMQVDEKGEISNYGNRRPWIEWAIGRALKQKVEVAILKTLEDQSDQINKQIVRLLQMKNSPLVKQIAEGITKVALSADRLKYSINVTADVR